MCILGGAKQKAPGLPPPPPQAPTAADPDVGRARADEQARLRAMSNTGGTLLTAGKDLSEAMTTGKKALGA